MYKPDLLPPANTTLTGRCFVHRATFMLMASSATFIQLNDLPMSAYPSTYQAPTSKFACIRLLALGGNSTYAADELTSGK